MKSEIFLSAKLSTILISICCKIWVRFFRHSAVVWNSKCTYEASMSISVIGSWSASVVTTRPSVWFGARPNPSVSVAEKDVILLRMT